MQGCDSNRKYKNIEPLGILLKTAREAMGVSREEAGRWILGEQKVCDLEEGIGGDFWEIRQLAGRLHIPSNALVAYLDPSDHALADCEMEIWYDLLFWKYEQAEGQLQDFYEHCDRENVAMMQVYYKLLALFLVRRECWEDERVGGLRDFVEKNMPDFEGCLRARKIFSPDEIALIVSYDRLVERETAGRLEKLYDIVYYFREVFAQEEHQHPFYAELMFAYAQDLYAVGDYMNCVEQCLEGIKVTKHFRKSVVGGELYELMSDAKTEMLKRELVEKKLMLEDQGAAKQIIMILDGYQCADAQYRAFYSGYWDGHKKGLERKMEEWKTMIGQKS